MRDQAELQKDAELRLASPPFFAQRDTIDYVLSKHEPLKVLDAIATYE